MQDGHFSEESDVQQALKALSEAQDRALRSGRAVTLLIGDELVRLDSQGRRTLLKTLPQRRVVSGRKKRARQ